MTVGIYKLVFEGTNKVYIGQSVNIEKRFKEHLNNFNKSLAPPKLQEAYQIYGIPSMEIVCTCLISDLDSLEEGAIDVFDSFNNGFNSLNRPGNPNIKGADSCHAKLPKETYVEIFLDLVNTNMLIKDIAKKYNTGWYTVSGIALGHTHIWLSEEFPEEYKKLKALIGTRQRGHKDKVPLLKSPEGEIFALDCSYREFARIHELASSAHLSNLINGKRKSYLKWTFYGYE